ncbi:FeoA family protein [Acidipropionibacterium virtanenii]|nr:FeoA family protein [Acidipropionibacterium virtanenii]
MSSSATGIPGDPESVLDLRPVDESLASCVVDEERVLVRAEGDLRMRRRLAALGLRRGAPVTLMMRTAGGGAVVSVAGSRIALDRSMLRSLHISTGEVA